MLEGMTTEIATVLALLGVAILLFASERIRVDVVSMMVLLSLILVGVLTPEEAFSGFSNPAVITVWAIYIISFALTVTGVADAIGQRIMRIAGPTEASLIAVIMLTVGVMSAFMNNIGATAVLLPAIVGIGRRVNIPASKLLIPLAFGSLLGGVTTLIGTPPNLLASNALGAAGLEPFALFDYTPMGLIVMFSGIAYFVLVGRHLLPSRTEHGTDDLTSDYELRDYLTELRVREDSPLVGKTILGSRLGELYDFTVVGVVRDKKPPILGVAAQFQIEADDTLLIRGAFSKVMDHRADLGVEIKPHAKLSELDLTSEDAMLAEVVVGQRANIEGQTLKSLDFRRAHDLTVLGIWRGEHPVTGSLGDAPLQLGDVLLVHGPRDRIARLRYDDSFLILQPVKVDRRRRGRAPLALAIFVGMIVSVAVGWVHISVAAVGASILLVLTHVIDMDEAYDSIHWKSVFLIAGMLPMGLAMDKTGTAEYLADLIVGTAGDLGPRAIMIGLFVLTTIITEFMSNAAAAVLVAPIAISTAATMNASPYAFVMGVAIAASNSFMFPIGHQASVLVYAPGSYRFFDYTRVGLPLTLLIWVLLVIFLPLLWPLTP
jgi:di/tricarboxylate transporter